MLCSFTAGNWFASNLSLLDADHVLHLACLQIIRPLFWYSLHQILTKSGGRLVRSQDVCALFLISFYSIKTHILLARRPYVLCFNAPSSLADWIERFVFPQIVCALIQCSFHFMLTKSDALLSRSSCVPCFNTPLRLMLTESDALPNNRTYYQEIGASLVWPDSFDSTKSGWRHILSINIGLA